MQLTGSEGTQVRLGALTAADRSSAAARPVLTVVSELPPDPPIDLDGLALAFAK
jgi:hypothetical protein